MMGKYNQNICGIQEDNCEAKRKDFFLGHLIN